MVFPTVGTPLKGGRILIFGEKYLCSVNISYNVLVMVKNTYKDRDLLDYV